MPVEVDRFFSHLVPRPKRIVAKNDQMSVQREFGVMLNACPRFCFDDALRIVVSDDQVFDAVQAPQKLIGSPSFDEAKSPRCQISSSTPTTAFQLAMSAASCSAMVLNGRRSILRTLVSVKCVSLVKNIKDKFLFWFWKSTTAIMPLS